MIVSIDPGVHDSAVAVWSAPLQLERLEYGDIETLSPLLWERDLVIEIPQVYRASISKGDPNDLIDLAFVAGWLGCLGSSCAEVRPREWKGQAKKHVVEARIREDNPDFAAWIDRMFPRSVRHNLFDAVGIGLWWFREGATSKSRCRAAAS